MPPAFYAEAFAIAARHNRAGHPLVHSYQTNATLLDDAWCDFIRRHAIRIGVSLDGPAFLHDRQRVTRHGRGTHRRVMDGVARLRRHRIPFHVITVLTLEALDYPDELYAFYVEHGIERVGFNIEEIEGPHQQSSLTAPGAEQRFRQFLSRFYDLTARPGSPRARARVRFDAGGDPPRRRRRRRARRRRRPSPSCPSTIGGTSPPFRPSCSAFPVAHYGDFLLGNVFADSLESAARAAALRGHPSGHRGRHRAMPAASARTSPCAGAAPRPTSTSRTARSTRRRRSSAASIASRSRTCSWTSWRALRPRVPRWLSTVSPEPSAVELRPGIPLGLAPRFQSRLAWIDRVQINGGVEVDAGHVLPASRLAPPHDAELELLLADGEAAARRRTSVARTLLPCSHVGLLNLPSHLRREWWALADDGDRPAGDGEPYRAFVDGVIEFLRFKRLPLPRPVSGRCRRQPPRSTVDAMGCRVRMPRRAGLQPRDRAARAIEPRGRIINLGDEPTHLVLLNLAPSAMAAMLGLAGADRSRAPGRPDLLRRFFTTLADVSADPRAPRGRRWPVAAGRGVVYDVCTLDKREIDVDPDHPRRRLARGVASASRRPPARL